MNFDRKKVIDAIYNNKHLSNEWKQNCFDILETIKDHEDDKMMRFLMVLSKMIAISTFPPKCTDCDNKASLNRYWPNSSGGLSWELCDTCFEKDNE